MKNCALFVFFAAGFIVSFGGPTSAAAQISIICDADWEWEGPPIVRTDQGFGRDSCLFGNANATVDAQGERVGAQGYAYDGTTFCDVQASAVATGSLHEAWNYTGMGQGDIEYDLTAFMDTWVELDRAESAGAVTGYARFQSAEIGDLVAEAGVAVETKPGQVGSITFEFGRGQITLGSVKK